MDTETNYYSPLNNLNNSQKSNSINEKVNPKLRKNKVDNKSTSVQYVKKYKTIDSISNLNHKTSIKNKTRNNSCYATQNNTSSEQGKLDSESKKEIANLISSIRKQNTYDTQTSLFLPDEKENIPLKPIKSKKSKKSKKSTFKSVQNQVSTNNNDQKESNSRKSSINEDGISPDTINESSSNFNSKINCMITQEPESIDFGEPSYSISNDNTLTTISSKEGDEFVGNRINRDESYATGYSSSLKASSISSCADDEETEKTISNESKLTRSKSKSKQKKNSVGSSGAKKFTNFRRKYLARPIKYSVSSVFKYGVGALSSLFNLRVDDVFGIEDYNKEILKEATLKGIADYIKSGKAKNIIVLTGAGISTNAGIPDFRSPKTGLYSNLKKYNLPYPEAIFTLEYFKVNPEPFYHMARQFYPGYYKPTITHYFIKELQNRKLLLRNYTQNIDALERICGIQDEKIVEAHGSFNYAYCVGTKDKPGCRKTYDYKWLYSRLFPINKKFVIPRCEKCNGLVKPAISFFGEPVPDKVSDCAKEDFPKCDLLMVIGTSLKVEPLSRLVNEVAPNVPRLLINKTMVSAFESDKPQRRSSISYNLDHFDIFNDPDDVEVIINRDVIALGNCDETCLKLAGLLGFKNKLLQTYDKEIERLAQETDLDSEMKKEIEEYVPGKYNVTDNNYVSTSQSNPSGNTTINNEISTLTSNTSLSQDDTTLATQTNSSIVDEKLHIPTSLRMTTTYSDVNTDIGVDTLSKMNDKPNFRKSLPPSSKNHLLSLHKLDNDTISNVSSDKHLSLSSALSGPDKRISVSSSLVAHAPSSVVNDTDKEELMSDDNRKISDTDQDNASMVMNYHEDDEQDESKEEEIFKDTQESFESSFENGYQSVESLASSSSEESPRSISPRISHPNKILVTTNSYHHSIGNSTKSEINFDFDIEATMNNITNTISTTLNNTQAAITTAIANSTALKETLINEFKRNSLQALFETKDMIINNNLANTVQDENDNDKGTSTKPAIIHFSKNGKKLIESQPTEYKDCESDIDNKTLLTLLEEEEEREKSKDSSLSSSQELGLENSIIKGILTPVSENSPELLTSIPRNKSKNRSNKLRTIMYLSPSNSDLEDEEDEDEDEDYGRFYSLPLKTDSVQPNKKIKTSTLPESSSSSSVYSNSSSSSSCSSPSPIPPLNSLRHRLSDLNEKLHAIHYKQNP